MDIPGFVRSYRVEVFDAQGNHLKADDVRVVSSNESVAVVSAEKVSEIRSTGGRIYRQKEVTVRLLAVGKATIRATLGSHVAASEVQVRPLPSHPATVSVEAFEVSEFLCSGGRCPYPVYVPVLRLRETTGSAPVIVEAFEVVVPGHTSLWCRGALRVDAGASVHLLPLDPYLYSNDVVFGALPLDEPATARVIVRDHQGQLGILSATTRIGRNGSAPLPWGQPIGWDCR
jgi:hypothetical protein